MIITGFGVAAGEAFWVVEVEAFLAIMAAADAVGDAVASDPPAPPEEPEFELFAQAVNSIRLRKILASPR